jgi:hypothetical protein
VLNETVAVSTVVLNHWRGLELPVLEIGPFFLLVAMVAAAHRWRPGYTAARADRLLTFQDRFTSLLDFADRGDVSSAVRSAQAAEARAALAGRSLREALPLRPLHFAGPLLLLLTLGYPLFLPSSPTGLVGLLRRDRGPAKNRNLRSDGTLDTAGDAPRAVQGPRGKDTPVGDRGKPRSNAPSAQEPPAADRGNGTAPGEAEFKPPGTAVHRKGGPMEGPLVSERVGKQLTQVVNPLFQEGRPRAAVPEQPAGGTIAFRLLPKSGKTGTGDGSGSGENPEAVSLDLDAVPEAYRQLVKTYFILLSGDAGPARPAGDGKPPGSARKD